MTIPKQLALQYIRTKFKLLSFLSKRKAAQEAFQLFCTPQHRNIKSLPKIFEQAESLQFNFRNYRIQGYRWNSSATKKVLILHGFESGFVNFDRYVKPLVMKGYCVMGFDAPAHGRSSGEMINVLIYKEFVERIQEKFGPIQSFIAHSFGGLAISLAMEEWQNNAQYKLVLIAPATETATAVQYLFDILRLPHRLREEFEKVIIEKGGHPTTWFSVARAAKNIRAQVLWLHDKDDDMTPLSDVVPVMKMNYPNFRFHITEGLGHRRIYRDNEVAAEIIRFL